MNSETENKPSAPLPPAPAAPAPNPPVPPAPVRVPPSAPKMTAPQLTPPPVTPPRVQATKLTPPPVTAPAAPPAAPVAAPKPPVTPPVAAPAVQAPAIPLPRVNPAALQSTTPPHTPIPPRTSYDHASGGDSTFYTRSMEHGRASIMAKGNYTTQREDSRKPLANGTVVGQYLIVSLMGEGGFGLTYRSIRQTDGKVVVLKEHMPAGVAVRDEDGIFVTTATPESEEYFISTLDEFRDEISTLMGLEHPNIVRIEDSFEANGTAYYVMPLVQGSPMEIPKLAELDPGKKAREARRIKQQLMSLLDALVYLDQNNIVHRDLKPENILVTPEGQPIILDFGSARQLRPGREYSNMYTPAFCAPEQCASHHDKKWGGMPMGPRTDLYSLGACIYYRITRLLPPKAETRIFSHPNDPYRPLAKRKDLLESYGEIFLGALDRALALDIEDRWQHAQDWRTYLGQGVHQLNSGRKLRSAIPYLTTLFFAILSAVFFLLYLDKEREKDAMTEASSTFTSKLLSDFFTDARDLPGVSPIQDRLCRYLVDYLNVADDFADADDESHKETTALAYMDIALFHASKGDLAGAAEGFLKAEASARRLLEISPNEHRYRYLLARTQLHHSIVLLSQAKDKEAEELVSEALELLRAVCKERPQSPEYACALARALLQDAEIKNKRGDIPAANKTMKELNQLLRSTRELYPNHQETRLRIAEAAHLQGVIDLNDGNYDAAEKNFRDEIGIYTQLLERRPFSLTYLRGRAQATFRLGHVFMERSIAEPERADTYLAKASELYQRHVILCIELQKLDENRPEFIFGECTSLAALQRIVLRNGKLNLAEAYATKLMRKAERLTKLSPDDINYTCMHAAAWRSMAAVHRREEEGGLYDAEEELKQSRDILEKAMAEAPMHPTLLNTYVLVMEESAALELQLGEAETEPSQQQKHKENASAYLNTALEKVQLLKKSYPHDSVYPAMEKEVRGLIAELDGTLPHDSEADDKKRRDMQFFHIQFK